jgi:cytochrome b subunit of formate dehydrogenase
LLLLFPAFLPGQDNETCIACHEDESLEITRYGVPISLYVTEEDLEETPHEGFDCIDCHTDLDGVEDFPHPPNLALPDCGTCHEDAQTTFIDGFFQPLREKGYTSLPSCVDCHGKHKVSWKGQPRRVCGVCHQDILEEFLHSAHWDGEVDTTSVTCVSCHHPHNKVEKAQYSAAEWKLRLTESCRKCHESEVENYDRSGHYREVQHGNLEAPICSDCHARHRILSPRDPDSKVSVARLDMVCTRCHSGYEKSIHRPEVGDDPRLETCVACHTGHSTEMAAESVSAVFDLSLSQICLKCHQASLITGENDAHGGIHRNQIQRLEWGEVANCGLCHMYHYRAPDHLSEHGLEKSCADCHPEQQEEYEKSSHYIARAKGHEEAPGCMTCHGERIVQKPKKVFTGQHIVELCGGCHSNRDVVLKFQLNPDVVAGYNTSYHGQMYQLGYQGEEFATCISCHDNHSILPPDNPESTVSQAHIIETCGKCHENVNINFVKYLQHYTPMKHKENPVLVGIHTFMVWLLGSVLVIFGGHSLLWLTRLTIKRIQEGPIKQPPKSRYRVRRFTLLERLQHFGLIISFLTLASTGLPLKYSQSRIANWIANHIVGFKTAALLHRGAALLLIIVFIVHLGHVLYKKFGQGKVGIFYGPHSLVPRLQDFKDFFAHLGYFIGVRPDPPKFGRWTYWEKFDYFAVFWGMVIIGASGLTLWFPEQFTRWVPGWLINAAHIIHSEEALLATAFIFTVHFFNTHLRPGAFPMDEVIFTGRMTEERFKEERPLELEELSPEKYKARLVKPLEPTWRRIAFITGYTFLFIGFALLAVIVIGTFF